MKYNYIRLSLAFLFILSLLGCGQASTPQTAPAKEPVRESSAGGLSAYPMTLKDDSGVEVTIAKQPERIVSIVPSTTETAFALGLGERIVGVSDHDNYPEEAKAKEKIGGFEVNAEKILSLKPDLVLSAATMTAQTNEKLSSLGLTVLAVEPKSIEGVFRSIELVAKATGSEDKAQELIAGMKAEREQVAEALKDLSPEEKPAVWLELDESLFTAGQGSILDEMIRLAGGVNIAGEQPGWPQFSNEKIIAANPEVILLNYNHIDQAVEKVKGRAGWDTTAAVQQGRVYQLDPDLTSRPGPRITKGLLQMARLLHPDHFPEEPVKKER